MTQVQLIFCIAGALIGGLLIAAAIGLEHLDQLIEDRRLSGLFRGEYMQYGSDDLDARVRAAADYDGVDFLNDGTTVSRPTLVNNRTGERREIAIQPGASFRITRDEYLAWPEA